MGTTMWWWVLAAGTVSVIAAGAANRRGTAGRVPRLGAVPPSGVRPPWWSHALLSVGILLMTLAAGRLGDADGSYFAYLGGAMLAALSVQAALVAWHNHRVTPGRDTDGSAPAGPSGAG